LSTEFRVWAPLPKKVELRLGNETLPMSSKGGGWWSARAPASQPGVGYGFVLDGEGPFPDPRSAWQPEGVHGLSRWVDQSRYGWTDQEWQPPPLSSALIYELHPGTFTPEGQFDSIIGKLDYLRGLGVTHVELMPANEFDGPRGWGYDGVDLFAPHHWYGGPDGLKRLVNACHARGLAVLLDVVYNHLGPSGNYLAKFGPYFNARRSTPWGPALNFDGPDSGEVRRFFCDNALMWLRDYHFDGLRLDAVHAIVDASARPFLEQLKEEVEGLEACLRRRLVLIPESDLNDPRLLWAREHGGFALDAQWSDDFHHALHVALTGEQKGYYQDFGALGDLCYALGHAYVYEGQYSRYRRRRHGRAFADLSGARFLGYLQNHDQVGNRAQGDRMGQLAGARRAKIGAALVLTAPFVPMLFQGEEWAASTPFQYFTSFDDPELGRAVSEGRRAEFAHFGWNPEEVSDPQAKATFDRCVLNWPELAEAPHEEMLEWYRRLIRLRQRTPALADGRLDLVRTRCDESGRWLVVERGPITVACNFAAHEQPIPLRPGAQTVLLASGPLPHNDAGNFTFPAESAAVLELG
jgi:maltooligosyltrehalose trehalohydrolase